MLINEKKKMYIKKYLKILLPFFTIFLPMWTICLILIKFYFAIIGLFFITILGIFYTLIMSFPIAEIELHEDNFSVTTFFEDIVIEYNHFIIYDIIRTGSTAMSFVIHSNTKKIMLNYSEKNYATIKLLLQKTESKYTLSQFENMMNNFIFKPYAGN